MKLKEPCTLEEKLWQTNPDIALKSRNIFDDKGTSSQICGLSSSHVPVFPVSHKEGWMLKNRYFWTVVLEKTLEGPLDSKEFTPVLKEMKPEYSLEGLMLKLKLQYFWPSDMKSWLIGKDPDAEKDWRQEKGMTEDEMVGWHHRLNGHEFEQTLGDSGGQGSLVCCNPWGRKESKRLSNWTTRELEELKR